MLRVRDGGGDAHCDSGVAGCGVVAVGVVGVLVVCCKLGVDVVCLLLCMCCGFKPLSRLWASWWSDELVVVVEVDCVGLLWL